MEQGNSPRIRAQFFGKFEVWLDGVDLTPQLVKRSKTALLLKFLLSKRGRVFTQDQLLEALFPDVDPDKSSQNLRGRISELREILEPNLSRGNESQFVLRAGPQKYCFSQETSCWLDIEELQRLLNTAEEQADEEKKVRFLQEAIALYRGDVLEDCYDDWVLEDRDYFRDLCIKTLQQLVRACTKCQDYAQAINYAKQILTKNSLQEEAHRALMYLYYVTGDRNAALRQFRECEQILKAELGIEPLPETKVIFHEIEERANPARLQDLATQARELIRHYPELGAPFVGRADEWQRLARVWEEIKQGKGQAWLLSGEAGVGKSRLAQEFLNYATAQGSLVLSGRCYEVKGKLSYQALVDALRHELPRISPELLSQVSPLWRGEVVKLLPELSEKISSSPPSTQLLSPEQERNRLFEGLHQFFASLSQPHPLILFLDDLQWADESTLQFINYLIPRLSDKRIFLLGAYRAEEVGPRHPLGEILQQLLRNHLIADVKIAPLHVQEVEELVQGMLKSKELDGLWPWVYEESKGVPFFAVELVKSFVEAGALTLDDQGTWKMEREKLKRDYIPASVRALIETRLRRVSRPSRQMLDLAAVAGRAFTTELLTQSLGRSSEDVFDRLEELLRAHVIVEEQDQFNFRHDVIREVVYRGLMPEQRRKLLHKSVGEALERTHAQCLDIVAGELAHHFLRAEVWGKAMEYSIQSGERAWKAYAKQEALGAFYKALELAQKLNHSESLMRAYKGLAQVCCFTDKHEEGLQHCLKALELCKDPHERVDIYDALVNVYHYKSDQETALKYCEQSISELGKDDSSLQMAKILNRAATMLTQLSRYDQVIEYCTRSLKILEGTEQYSLLADAYGKLGSAYRGKGDFDKATTYCLKATLLAEQTGDIRSRMESYSRLGRLYSDKKDIYQAIEWWQKAIADCETMGNLNGLGYLYENISYAYMKASEIDQALEQAQKRLKVWSKLGNGLEIAISHGILACLYRVKGWEEKSETTFREALRMAHTQPELYMSICGSYSALGQTDDGILWLRKGLPCLTNRFLNNLKTLPIFENLRRDPRFHELVLKEQD